MRGELEGKRRKKDVPSFAYSSESNVGVEEKGQKIS